MLICILVRELLQHRGIPLWITMNISHTKHVYTPGGPHQILEFLQQRSMPSLLRDSARLLPPLLHPGTIENIISLSSRPLLACTSLFSICLLAYIRLFLKSILSYICLFRRSLYAYVGLFELISFGMYVQVSFLGLFCHIQISFLGLF